MDSATERKAKHYLREAAKLLKEDTPEEQLQDFESIELAVRKHIVEIVGPEIGTVFFQPEKKKARQGSGDR